VTQPESRPSNWRKSRASGDKGDCVEVAVTDGYVLVRDSKNRNGTTLRFSNAEWAAFLAGARDGEFNIPSPRGGSPSAELPSDPS
jgi:hypothetical protein